MKIISQLICRENSALFVTTYNIWACSVEVTQVKNLFVGKVGHRGDREGSGVSRGASACVQTRLLVFTYLCPCGTGQAMSCVQVWVFSSETR